MSPLFAMLETDTLQTCSSGTKIGCAGKRADNDIIRDRKDYSLSVFLSLLLWSTEAGVRTDRRNSSVEVIV